MSSAHHEHQLKLVGNEDLHAMESWHRVSEARHAIEAENRAAGRAVDLDPTDPRWVLAVRAEAQLEGTTLTPERRQRLLRTADAMGIRPFDANVILAIVQDRARRGEGLASARELISMTPNRPTRTLPLRWRIVIVIFGAMVMAFGIVRWIVVV